MSPRPPADLYQPPGNPNNSSTDFRRGTLGQQFAVDEVAERGAHGLDGDTGAAEDLDGEPVGQRGEAQRYGLRVRVAEDALALAEPYDADHGFAPAGVKVVMHRAELRTQRCLRPELQP